MLSWRVHERFSRLMHFQYSPALLVLFVLFVMWAVLFVLAEYGDVSLKPLKSWLAAACWLLWGITALPLSGSVPRPWRFAALVAYGGATSVLAWVKRSYLFESKVKPSRSLASWLTIPQPTYVAVRDVSTAVPWYVEKLGLRKLAATEQARKDGVALQFNEKTHPVILIPKDPAAFRPAPVFFTRKIGKVRDVLTANCVSAGPVQQDRQGTNFFELQDSQGTTIEISERP